MTTTNSAITTYVLTPLNTAGLHAAPGNLFDQEETPLSALNNSYSLTDEQNGLLQAPGCDYNDLRIRVRVVRCWSASSNVTKTYLEAKQDMYDLADALVNALTTGGGDQDGCRVERWDVNKFTTADWLALDIDLVLQYPRAR